MKRSIAYIIVFITLCLICNYSIDYVQGKQIKEQSPYYLSFASIGANYLESRLDCWAKIKTSSTTEELQDYLNSLLQSLDIILEPELLTITDTDATTILHYGMSRSGENLFIAIKSDKQLNETYFSLSIVCQDQKKCLDKYEGKLNQVIGLKWQYYYLYTGELPYVVPLDDQYKIITVMLKTMKACKVDAFDNNEITNVIAFSPSLEEKVPVLRLNGTKYNLQIAIRNNNRKAKTYIYIGSPLILGVY